MFYHDYMRTCKRCGESKPLEAYHKYAAGGYNTHCKPCNTVRGREYQQKNRARLAEQNLRKRIKYKYGLDWEAYCAMLEAGCMVCGDKDSLQVDHDHTCCPGINTCGQCVRGMLCKRHNVILGWAHDSVDELGKMIEYLLAFEARRCYT